MYITRRRSPVKKKLIQEKLKRNIANNICPACKGDMQLLESKEDSDIYACKKCHATNTFMKQNPYVQKKNKEIRLNAITLVDRSSERKYDYKNKEKKAQPAANDMLAIIRKAMAEKKLLQFEYPKEKETVTRLTEPYKLALDGSRNAILWAYCTDAEAIRIFKLEKMHNVEVKDYNYKPRWEIEDKLDNDKNKEKGDGKKTT